MSSVTTSSARFSNGGSRLLRVSIRETVKALRYMTAPLRGLPDFVIIGAQRAGTTSLFHYVVQHPRIVGGFPKKELHYFDYYHARGPYWYKARFPSHLYKAWFQRRQGSELLAGESTPYYLFHPCVPSRMKELVPDVKLIAALRNPVDRALSHYHHEVRRGRETLDFEDALKKEAGRLRAEKERLLHDPTYHSFAHQRLSYLERGLYAQQLEEWYRHFPREQFLVLRSEDLFRDAQWAVNRVFDFLGCEPWAVDTVRVHNQLEYQSLDPDLRRRLGEFFESPNRRLEELLGFELGWT